jgi:regulatory protein YycH of two-component signal transduction system YycFG
MRYETIKSIILLILVSVSIFFTWNLWTYQPNLKIVENSNNTISEVSLSEKKDIQKIVRPDRVLYHYKGDHFGTNNSVELDKLIKELSSWSFFDVKNYTEEVGDIKDLTHGAGNAEIIFPSEIPIELYRSVLNIEGRKVPTFNFNRIIINVENTGSEDGIVYFVSTVSGQVYISNTSPANLNTFNRDFFKNAAKLPRYFVFEAAENRTLFLPEGETEMFVYKYLPVTLNSDEFKEALFRDPKFVQRNIVGQNEEYSSDTSKMTVNNDTNILSYVNPTSEDDYVESSYELVKRSIDFVNEHGGWTDTYRYVFKNEYQASVVFRLYTNEGYPVFNDRGLSEIYQTWGRNEINQYIRPNIALELPLTTEMQRVTRPSGHLALEFLQSKPNFKPELLEDLVLGYRMERDKEENRLILLEPAWFYRYHGTWGEITMEELGGLKHGLE